MVQLTCQIEGCSYVTVDGSEVIECSLLAAYTPAHTVASAPMTSGPKLDRLFFFSFFNKRILLHRKNSQKKEIR